MASIKIRKVETEKVLWLESTSRNWTLQTKVGKNYQDILLIYLLYNYKIWNDLKNLMKKYLFYLPKMECLIRWIL